MIILFVFSANSNAAQTTIDDDDDGFGDFLQGPSVESIPQSVDSQVEQNHSSSPEPATLPVEEKKGKGCNLGLHNTGQAPRSNEGSLL